MTDGAVAREAIRWHSDVGGYHRVIVVVDEQLIIKKQSSDHGQYWETDWAHHSYGHFEGVADVDL